MYVQVEALESFDKQIKCLQAVPCILRSSSLVVSEPSQAIVIRFAFVKFVPCFELNCGLFPALCVRRSLPC